MELLLPGGEYLVYVLPVRQQGLLLLKGSFGFLGCGGRLCYYGPAQGAFRWFNRRSYSRIFAALTDEETSETFAKKYRRSEYYRELYGQLAEEYGKGCCLPPEAETENEAAWEKAPRRLPRRVRTAAAPEDSEQSKSAEEDEE